MAPKWFPNGANMAAKWALEASWMPLGGLLEPLERLGRPSGGFQWFMGGSWMPLGIVRPFGFSSYTHPNGAVNTHTHSSHSRCPPHARFTVPVQCPHLANQLGFSHYHGSAWQVASGANVFEIICCGSAIRDMSIYMGA